MSHYCLGSRSSLFFPPPLLESVLFTILGRAQSSCSAVPWWSLSANERMPETCGQNDNNPPTLELILGEANMRKLKLINEQIKKSAKYPKLGTSIYLFFPFHLASFIS